MVFWILKISLRTSYFWNSYNEMGLICIGCARDLWMYHIMSNITIEIPSPNINNYVIVLNRCELMWLIVIATCLSINHPTLMSCVCGEWLIERERIWRNLWFSNYLNWFHLYYLFIYYYFNIIYFGFPISQPLTF